MEKEEEEDRWRKESAVGTTAVERQFLFFFFNLVH